MPGSAVRTPATTASMVTLALVGARPAGAGEAPRGRIAATCADYQTQADAQRAADTRDTDGDGIYCVISPR